MLNAELLKKIFVSFLGVVLVLLVFLGYRSGVALAQTTVLLKQQNQVFLALERFKQDQDRYPTPVEFENIEVMSKYLSNLPLIQFKSTDCVNSFEYLSSRVSEAQLKVCLPASASGYPAGVSIYNSPFINVP
jgi:hypothetical protein